LITLRAKGNIYAPYNETIDGNTILLHRSGILACDVIGDNDKM
jgi:hypothetical protein